MKRKGRDELGQLDWDEIATLLTGLAMTIRKESFAMTEKIGAF